MICFEVVFLPLFNYLFGWFVVFWLFFFFGEGGYFGAVFAVLLWLFIYFLPGADRGNKYFYFLLFFCKPRSYRVWFSFVLRYVLGGNK